MSDLSMQIGNRLRAARKAAGFKSARAFAEKYEIPESTYSQHELGKRSLNADTLMKYSALCAINPSWLLTGAGQPYLSKNTSKEKLLFSNLEPISNAVSPTLDLCIQKDGISTVDMALFVEIIQRVVRHTQKQCINLGVSELIEFCIDVYNGVIATSADEANKETMIDLSVSSLQRGAKQHIEIKRELL